MLVRLRGVALVFLLLVSVSVADAANPRCGLQFRKILTNPREAIFIPLETRQYLERTFPGSDPHLLVDRLFEHAGPIRLSEFVSRRKELESYEADTQVEGVRYRLEFAEYVHGGYRLRMIHRVIRLDEGPLEGISVAYKPPSPYRHQGLIRERLRGTGWHEAAVERIRDEMGMSPAQFVTRTEFWGPGIKEIRPRAADVLETPLSKIRWSYVTIAHGHRYFFTQVHYRVGANGKMEEILDVHIFRETEANMKMVYFDKLSRARKVSDQTVKVNGVEVKVTRGMQVMAELQQGISFRELEEALHHLVAKKGDAVHGHYFIGVTSQRKPLLLKIIRGQEDILLVRAYVPSPAKMFQFFDFKKERD